jgi:hypothetical protein
MKTLLIALTLLTATLQAEDNWSEFLGVSHQSRGLTTIVNNTAYTSTGIVTKVRDTYYGAGGITIKQGDSYYGPRSYTTKVGNDYFSSGTR